MRLYVQRPLDFQKSLYDAVLYPILPIARIIERAHSVEQLGLDFKFYMDYCFWEYLYMYVRTVVLPGSNTNF